MESINLLEKVRFSEKGPHAEPVHVDPHNRVLLFNLEPGQTIKEHNAPSSPFDVVILQGKGVFAGGDGQEHTFGPNILLTFEPGENHSIRAIEQLTFVGFLHGAPGAQPGVTR